MITDEQAKAGQEIAKTTGKFAEIAEKVGGFISKLIGPASNEVGGILEDWTRYYRFKNLIAIADKVEAIHAKRKIAGNMTPIAPRIAIPMLESASLEDDDKLQDVWARLIANSTDPSFKNALHPGYIEIIKQLSPDEAIILDSFKELIGYPILFTCSIPKQYETTGLSTATRYFDALKKYETYENIYQLYKSHCTNLKLINDDDALVYIDNLLRLRIVELSYDFISKPQNTDFFGMRLPDDENASIAIPGRNEYLRLTPFGLSFITACIS